MYSKETANRAMFHPLLYLNCNSLFSSLRKLHQLTLVRPSLLFHNKTQLQPVCSLSTRSSKYTTFISFMTPRQRHIILEWLTLRSLLIPPSAVNECVFIFLHHSQVRVQTGVLWKLFMFNTKCSIFIVLCFVLKRNWNVKNISTPRAVWDSLRSGFRTTWYL